MRVLPLFLCLAVLSVTAVAEPLSSADRETLLDSLKKLRGTVTERTDARFRAAVTAYRSAMLSESAAVELYLKCVEKANFDDLHKKAAEFREWKKKEDARISEPSMHRALMHQLRWLVLTLQAASEKADLEKLAPEGQQVIDDLFNDGATLATQQELLRQQVTHTVFARAYKIDAVKLEAWPLSPLELGAFYEQVQFPLCRTSGDLKALRACWMKRIHQEGLLYEPLAAKSKGNGRSIAPEASRPPTLEKFLTETQPELQWQMEVDLFHCGDQRAAAVRMIAHIENHLTHSRARQWSDEFKALLTPSPSLAPVTPVAPKPAEAKPKPAP